MFSLIDSLTVAAAFGSFVLGIVVFIENPRKPLNISFAIFSFTNVLWIFTNFIFSYFKTIFVLQSQYVLGSLIMPLALIWVYILIENRISYKKLFTLLCIAIGLCAYVNLDQLFTHMLTIVDGNAIIVSGPSFDIYSILTLALFIFFIYKLISSIKHSEGIVKIQLKLILLGSIAFGGISMMTSFILPALNIIPVGPYDAQSSLFFVAFSSYAILKHRLFNVKVVTTEFLVSCMWLFLLIKVLLSSSWTDAIINLVLFVVLVILGLILIKSALNEADAKEQIQLLASDLKEANAEIKETNLHLSEKVAEQTKEIRGAYDLEKHARRELEKLNETKNQFIMITQHHLRTPVTSIEWELESMLDGSYGPVSDQFKTALKDAKTATGRLTHIIDDFLNITAMKTGQNILTLTNRSLLPAIEDIVRELKTELGRRSITVKFPHEAAEWPELSIDFNKMHDILLIIIENAVKYNHDGGSVTMSTASADGHFELNIENTGIGISSEEIDKIGAALFYRGMDARKMNTVGMGVGLSVAKAIIKAHHGTFLISSAGKDKGAKVLIRLPLAEHTAR